MFTKDELATIVNVCESEFHILEIVKINIPNARVHQARSLLSAIQSKAMLAIEEMVKGDENSSISMETSKESEKRE